MILAKTVRVPKRPFQPDEGRAALSPATVASPALEYYFVRFVGQSGTAGFNRGRAVAALRSATSDNCHGRPLRWTIRNDAV